jgi:omega-6 fatty acid desaturase (delta-12 desaturase)
MNRAPTQNNELPDQRAFLRDLPRRLAAFRNPSDMRGAIELAITAVPLALLLVLMWLSLDVHYGIALLLAVPAAGLLVRLFLIQHDCGHGAFFRSRRANDWLGRIIALATMTPYGYWRGTHAHHHASSGNLCRRGIGDVTTLTVGEYEGLGWARRLQYRLYRHPAVLFGIGPAFVFFLQHRLPVGQMRHGAGPWLSTMATNGAIAAAWTGSILLIGLQPFLLILLPIMILGASLGVWLFFVQHQFEDTFWRRREDWKFADAAVYGSSHYALPPVLRWFTANIGVHHVHHLCSTIPFYRLPAVLRSHPELRDINRLTLVQSLKAIPLALWDEDARRMISFRAARERQRPAACAAAV